MTAMHFDANTQEARVPPHSGTHDDLRERLEYLPAAMRQARRWLLWKPGKVPCYVSGTQRNGTLDSPHDVAQLATLADALDALDRDSRFAGLGFALGFDAALGLHWQGLDLDKALDESGQFTTERARTLYQQSDGYAEVSPSGEGLHVIGLGAPFRTIKWSRPGEQKIELYAGARFFTVTGRMMREGDPADLAGLAERVRAGLVASGKVRERKAREHVNGSAAYLDRMPEGLQVWVKAHPIEAALAEHGYQRIGERWLSPRSESGIPGVTVLDDLRAVTFHASDAGIGTEVSGDAEVFNAFDCEVRYRFGDDRTRAWRELLPRTRQATGSAQHRPEDAEHQHGDDARTEGADEPPRFRFVTVTELLRTPAATWRVLRVIPARGLVVIWGASGSGKTFAALDMAGAIARGLRWAGRRTKRGTVAYIAAEGQLRDRVDAYLRHNGLGDLDGLRVLDSAVNLLDPTADIQALLASLRALAAETGQLAAVIVDTLNRVMPGGDENSSEDMGMVIAAAKLIEREFDCAVIFIHHSGKDESKGSRGHSSLKAATDAEVSVKRDGDIRTVTAEKVRDGADGEVLMTFRLLSVDLGAMSDTDPDAEPDERRTSCVVEPAEADAIQRPTAPAGGNQRVAWDRIGELLRQAGDVRPAGTPAEIPPGRPAITLDAAADGVAGRLVCEHKRRRERALEAIRGLVGRGLLCHAEGWIWCA